MKVDDQLVDRLAELSRLEFEAEEKVAIKEDLTKILSFMEQLNEVDTEGVEPLVYVNEVENIFREDEVKDQLSVEQVLQNAPIKNEEYIKVPKVISKK